MANEKRVPCDLLESILFIIDIRYLQPMGEVSYARCKNGVNIVARVNAAN
ncbi:MAG: hypothetical protein IPJ25_13655 [Rhodocyclaceae bacterium]|nr:hypothetical protein [Rhodocyclaceae bacterium]